MRPQEAEPPGKWREPPHLPGRQDSLGLLRVEYYRIPRHLRDHRAQSKTCRFATLASCAPREAFTSPPPSLVRPSHFVHLVFFF